MQFENMYRQFGELIKVHRTKMSLTQSQLAGKVGLSRASIANIEGGRQKIIFHQLFLFAKCLNISPSDLLPRVTADDDIQVKTVYDVMPANMSGEEAEFFKHILRKAQNG